MQEYRSILASELKLRQQTNPAFSLRAFARVLGLSPSHLSHLINGKRNLTVKQAFKISKILGLSPFQTRRIVGLTFNDTDEKSLVLKKRLLEEDEFCLISDWWHFAILSLSRIKENKATSHWISQHLGITTLQASDALDRLQRLNLIEIKNGKFRQISDDLTTTSESTSSAIRKYHKQNLDLAKEKIDIVPLTLRDFSSVTMAVNPSKIKKIKKLIVEMKDHICKEFEQGEPSEVYTLAIQLFPLTIPGGKK